jgi:hypothetical protein
MRWAEHVACIGEGKGAYRNSEGESEGKRPFGRPRRRWEDNIKMEIQEVGCGGMGWIELDKDRNSWRALLNAVIKFWGSIKCEEFLD